MELSELKSKYEESQRNLQMLKRLATAGLSIHRTSHYDLQVGYLTSSLKVKTGKFDGKYMYITLTHVGYNNRIWVAV